VKIVLLYIQLDGCHFRGRTNTSLKGEWNNIWKAQTEVLRHLCSKYI